MNPSSDIYNIIIRSFKNELTEEEKALLEAWKSETRQNRIEYLDCETIWRESDRLSSSMKIDLPGSLLKIKKQTGTDKVKITWKSLFLQAAAVLLLAVLFASAYNHFIRKEAISEPVLVANQEVKAPYGTQIRLELSDGTTVNLNSGSTLQFPVSFAGSDSRRVKLTGEGFFSVAKNKDKPFLVDVGSLVVAVTGTRFNVDAYPNNRDVTVALVEGTVNLQKMTDNGLIRLATMKPNEVASCDLSGNNLQVSHQENLDKYYIWTEGKIIFSDDPIQTVVKKLGTWYNVEIEIADKKMESYHFTGTFFDEPLSQVLYLLSISSGMKYTIIPAQKLEDNSYTKQKIIIKSKRI